MKIVFKSEKGNFNAQAIYENSKVTVLKNSKISNKIYNCKISSEIEAMRNDVKLIDNYVVIKNISFKSLSSAAQFVSGYKANGLRVWKTLDGKKISK